MLNAKGVLLHTTYNLLKASFWLVCSLEQGNITKRSGIQTKKYICTWNIAATVSTHALYYNMQ